jgi:hypothetical protein
MVQKLEKPPVSSRATCPVGRANRRGPRSSRRRRNLCQDPLGVELHAGEAAGDQTAHAGKPARAILARHDLEPEHFPLALRVHAHRNQRCHAGQPCGGREPGCSLSALSRGGADCARVPGVNREYRDGRCRSLLVTLAGVCTVSGGQPGRSLHGPLGLECSDDRGQQVNIAHAALRLRRTLAAPVSPSTNAARSLRSWDASFGSTASRRPRRCAHADDVGLEAATGALRRGPRPPRRGWRRSRAEAGRSSCCDRCGFR